MTQAEAQSEIQMVPFLEQCMTTYGMHVMFNRAIPDVKDGLKPTQRKLMWTAYEMGATNKNNYEPSADMIGHCTGKYIPAGEGAVYDAMVLLTRPWKQNNCLMNMHGNNGNWQDDARAAASRYTKCRLSDLGLAFFDDIKIADMKDNYAGKRKEPVILPAPFPNAFVNPTLGLAVGFRTGIPGANLGEVIDGLLAVLRDKQEFTLDTLLKHIKGPDFPTPCEIWGDFPAMYAKGESRIYMRSRLTTEKRGHRTYLMIKELPYNVELSPVITEVKQLIREGKLPGVVRITDESGRNKKTGKQQFQAAIELNSTANPELIKQLLYKHTACQSFFPCEMNYLNGLQLVHYNLVTGLQAWLDFRRETLQKSLRSSIENVSLKLDHTVARIWLSKNWKNVIPLVTDAADETESAQKIKDYALSQGTSLNDTQVVGILEMKISSLSKQDQAKLGVEETKLRAECSRLTEQSTPEGVDKLIVDQLTEIKKNFAKPRVCQIVEEHEDEPDGTEVPRADVHLHWTNAMRYTLSHEWKPKSSAWDKPEYLKLPALGKNEFWQQTGVILNTQDSALLLLGDRQVSWLPLSVLAKDYQPGVEYPLTGLPTLVPQGYTRALSVIPIENKEKASCALIVTNTGRYGVYDLKEIRDAHRKTLAANILQAGEKVVYYKVFNSGTIEKPGDTDADVYGAGVGIFFTEEEQENPEVKQEWAPFDWFLVKHLNNTVSWGKVKAINPAEMPMMRRQNKPRKLLGGKLLWMQQANDAETALLLTTKDAQILLTEDITELEKITHQPRSSVTTAPGVEVLQVQLDPESFLFQRRGGKTQLVKKRDIPYNGWGYNFSVTQAKQS
jgi:DNA gyrase/topoisomerase IV subunit A